MHHVGDAVEVSQVHHIGLLATFNRKRSVYAVTPYTDVHAFILQPPTRGLLPLD